MDQLGLNSTPSADDTLGLNGRRNESQSKNGTEEQSRRRTLRRIQDFIGLDGMTVLKMLKGGLPPIIVIAM
jgi:hypothetical protein